MYKKIIVMFVLIFFTAFSGALAFADQSGAPGVIKSLQRNAPTSDLFALNHALLVIKTEFGDDHYIWGGNLCPGIDLTSMMEEALNIYVGAEKMQIEPFFKSGAGGSRCLVSFTLLNTKIK